MGKKNDNVLILAFKIKTSKVEATFFLDQDSKRFHIVRKSQAISKIKKKRENRSLASEGLEAEV